MNEAVLPEEARYDGECVLGNKSGLGLRPFCDWTTKRIRAHVMVCCLTLVLAKAAELSNHAKLAFRTSGMRPPLYCQMARCPKEAQEGV